MMNRVEEYLSTLEKKQLYMLYASVILAAGVIYYNFNYNYLEKKVTETKNTLMKLKKPLNTKNLILKLSKTKKLYKQAQKQNAILNEDYRYLKLLINSSSLININKMKFLDILSGILQSASDNGIAASYNIEVKRDKYVVYEININGMFLQNNFENFYKFVKSLEKIKAVKNIKTLTFFKKDTVNFQIVCDFWSIK